MGLKVSSLQNEYDKINAENDALRVKINSILSLDKMDKIAKEKNLYKPGEEEIERID
jgi:cell division protein FtsL